MRLEVEADEWLERHGAALCPVAPDVAPPLAGSFGPVDGEPVRPGGKLTLSTYANALGLPAVAVPVMLTRPACPSASSSSARAATSARCWRWRASSSARSAAGWTPTSLERAVTLDTPGDPREGRGVTEQPATQAPERRNLADADLTQAVEASFDGTPDPRLREVLQALVRHLHAFATEVELTEEEWFAAIDFLTRTGHITDDKRQEFILASDTLGLSMLVIGMNHRRPPGATESTVFGPFFVEGSPAFENGDDLANGAPGTPCFMSGTVRSIDGEPVPGALLDIWQADEDGFYDVQYEGLDEARGRGHLHSDDEGRYWFWTVQPEAYPIPTDGPVGSMLAATNRSPMRPAHVHFKVTAPGYQTLITHVFDESDQYLDTDAVFGVRSSLLATFERHEPGTAPDGREMTEPWRSAQFDLVLAPEV